MWVLSSVLSALLWCLNQQEQNKVKVPGCFSLKDKHKSILEAINLVSFTTRRLSYLGLMAFVSPAVLWNIYSEIQSYISLAFSVLCTAL